MIPEFDAFIFFAYLCTTLQQAIFFSLNHMKAGDSTYGFCLPKPCDEKDGQNLIEFFFKECKN